MSMKQPLLTLGILLNASTFNANASLTSYTGAGDVGLVYSSISNVTWTQDANLFQTMASSNFNLVSQIASVTPSYSDPYWGLQTIDLGSFNTGTGQMTWWGAKAFVDYLNTISYGGDNHWRLPTSNAGAAYEGTSGNELGQLFYSELGGSAGNNIPSTTIFNNEQASVYWSGTGYAVPQVAWSFDIGIGRQDDYDKTSQYYAWAVSPGQVSAVPVPGAVWIFGTGLVGLLSLKRRGQTAG